VIKTNQCLQKNDRKSANKNMPYKKKKINKIKNKIKINVSLLSFLFFIHKINSTNGFDYIFVPFFI
jgi:hypothetical protein